MPITVNWPAGRAAIVTASAALVLLAACTKPEPAAEPIRAVKVITVGPSDLRDAQEFAGEVRARLESRMGFRVAGKLVQRPVELGQKVQAGQLLAVLDAQDYQLAVQAAQAQMNAAQTNRDLAAAEYKRFVALKEQNFISGAELERRESTLKAAQAQFEQAQAQYRAQGNQANYTQLVADSAGVITAIEAEPGQVVSAGQTVVRLARQGPHDVVIAVPEDKVAAVQADSQATVRSLAEQKTLRAKVRDIAASADPVTRTYAVKLSLEDGAPPLGSTVYVTLNALSRSGQQAILLPTSALRQEGQGSAVWVLDKASMTLRSQTVQVAEAEGNQVIVSAGLEPGMQVVATGVHVLQPGQKVTLYQEKAAPAPISAQSSAQSAASSAAPTAATPGSK